MRLGASLLYQSVDVVVGKTGGTDTRTRFAPPGDQLDRLNRDRHPVVRAQATTRQLGRSLGELADCGFDDLGFSQFVRYW